MLLRDGRGALFDPSSYYGHHEVDLAMADLFGGFDPRFYAAYHEVRPLIAGEQERRPVYQLYYALAHLVMFGRAYSDMVRRLLIATGAE
jgi:fructosamine-3-kinase